MKKTNKETKKNFTFGQMVMVSAVSAVAGAFGYQRYLTYCRDIHKISDDEVDKTLDETDFIDENDTDKPEHLQPEGVDEESHSDGTEAPSDSAEETETSEIHSGESLSDSPHNEFDLRSYYFEIAGLQDQFNSMVASNYATNAYDLTTLLTSEMKKIKSSGDLIKFKSMLSRVVDAGQANDPLADICKMIREFENEFSDHQDSEPIDDNPADTTITSNDNNDDSGTPVTDDEYEALMNALQSVIKKNYSGCENSESVIIGLNQAFRKVKTNADMIDFKKLVSKLIIGAGSNESIENMVSAINESKLMAA